MMWVKLGPLSMCFGHLCIMGTTVSQQRPPGLIQKPQREITVENHVHERWAVPEGKYSVKLDKEKFCLVKRLVFDDSFPYLSYKTYVVGTHYNCLVEAILIGTHNICFNGELHEENCPLIIIKDRPYLFLCCNQCRFSANRGHNCGWRFQ